MPAKKGLLIAFDGIDASGKATQVSRTRDRLQNQGFVVHVFETPDYTTKSGQQLKTLLQDPVSWQAIPWQEKLTFFADNRREHRDEVIHALHQGEIVVYDRYIPSSLTFMAVEAAHHHSVDDTLRQQVYTTVEHYEYEQNNMPKEDVSIFLDVPPQVALNLLSSRKQRRQDKDEYTDHQSVQESLYHEYDLLCTQQPQRFLRINCVEKEQIRTIDAVSELVWQGLTSRFPHLENKSL